MIKKSLLMLFTLLAAATAAAQQQVGDWRIFPLFSGAVDYNVETPEKVYYMSGGNLYSTDLEDGETYSYSIRNKLSDNVISNIYYNKDNKYLLITYDTGNIDLLYDNGKVVNMADIKDALLTSNKTINNVNFSGDRIYVSTVFGIVIFDDRKHQVVESGNYGESVGNMFELNGKLIVYRDFTLYWSELTDRHNTKDYLRRIGGLFARDLMPVAGTGRILANEGNSGCLRYVDIDPATNQMKFTDTGVKVESKIKVYRDGYYFTGAGKLVLLDKEGNMTSTIDLPADLTNNEICTWKGASSVWAGDSRGMGNYDLSGATPAVIADKSKPESITCREVVYLFASDDGQRIYMSNLGCTGFKTCGQKVGDGIEIVQTTNVLENGRITDVSLKEASANTNDVKNIQKKYNSKAMYGGAQTLVEDPEIPGRYYIGNGLEGLYVVENGVEIGHFDNNNAPLKSGWGTRVFDVNIDRQGNLWAGHWAVSDPTMSSYIVLPAEKRRQDPLTITMDDWIKSSPYNGYYGFKDMISLMCRQSNMMFFTNGGWQAGLICVDSKGTYTNPSDDESVLWSSLTDQDGNSMQPNYTICMVEDKRGRVWVGTSNGVYEITNPSASTSPSFRINRLKVPRNDGTNYADYLLDSDQVNAIAVDASNRKWIATEASGVYLVSENGDRIIEHFTTDNSYLPSNTVYSVVCDPQSSTVYFGTGYGLVSYNGTSSPAMEDYSNVYAYPNPVRPDYDGWITITGLMDNSLVKIADASGHVFNQGRSEGGMYVWDGLNGAGERVKSGVYFVFASQGTGSDSSQSGSDGVVTKILVIN